MKHISMPVNEQNLIEGHFGQCNSYLVYTVDDNNDIRDTQTINAQEGCGCKSNIASVLSERGVTVMLAGNMGAGAVNVLQSWGIEVIRGCAGEPRQVLDAFLKNQIVDSNETCHAHERACHEN